MNIVDARTWEVRPRRRPPSGCPRCGKPTDTVIDQIYCSQLCARKAYKIRRALRRGEVPEGELLTCDPGTCRVCGTAYDVEPVRTFCSPRCRRSYQNLPQYPFAYFRTLVKWPHDLAWLAKKLNVPPDDPRLPLLALKLAKAGKLVVYITKDSTIGEVGRPKEKP